jgi:hypothetical protein
MKYNVKVHYEYVAEIEVEANTPEEASVLGSNYAEGLPTFDLDFVGQIGTEVMDDKFNIILEKE